MAQALAGPEAGGEHPRVVEDGFVNGLVPVLFQDIGAEITGFVQGTGHGAGHIDLINGLLTFPLERPAGKRSGLCGKGRHHRKE